MKKRDLSFANLDEVVADAEMLHRQGYVATGKWDLAQICLHLSDWMSYPMDGFPKPPLPLRPIIWLMKVTRGKKMLGDLFAGKPFPDGSPTMKQSVHPSGLNEAEAVEKLKVTVERFKVFSQPLKPSPLFGTMDLETAERLQRIHCAHHLSFLLPKG